MLARLRLLSLPLLLLVIVSVPSVAQAKLTVESFTSNIASPAAGGHPDITLSTSFATELFECPHEPGEPVCREILPMGGVAREIGVKLPPGLVGDPQAVPQCPPNVWADSERLFVALNKEVLCPADTQVGVFDVTIGGAREETEQGNIYLLSGGPDAPARLGFTLFTILGPLPAAEGIAEVHEGEDYAIELRGEELNRYLFVATIATSVTIWGVPADQSHDGERGDCRSRLHGPCVPSDAPRLPFLDYPTDCSTVPVLTGFASTFAEPEVFAEESQDLPTPTGCGMVPFAPSVRVEPEPENPKYAASDSTRAGAPTGMTIEVSLPQNENPVGRETSALKEAVLRFPPGLAISPSAAAGNLQSCTDEEFAVGSDAPSRCPQSSLIGEDELETPLLPSPLKGKVYLGQPLNNEAKSGRMFRIFQEFEGFTIDVKLEGSVTANEQTGRLEVRAGANTVQGQYIPELPFTHFRVHTQGGPRAVLVNQPWCGPATTTAFLTPYSDPEHPATPSSTYTTSYDGQDASCPSSLPFAPAASLSMSSTQAGAFAPLTVVFSREDGMQPLGHFDVNLPPGLLGYVSSVALCEPQAAAAGECPPASRIGVVSATVGAGPDPLVLPGNIYLARGTNSYPFELSVVVPAIAGPFDLGNVTEVIGLEVHSNGTLSAVSGELPSIKDGVPTDIRTITATIQHADFTFNPTNCSPLSLGGQFTSLSGTVAQVSAPFEVSGCESLPFKPSFQVATSARTARAGGASLEVRAEQTSGQAHIHSVKVELPKQLPSRLTTLQKACPEATFASDPGTCPTGSVVGSAIVFTPLLDSPLSGPAFFVSHGGAKFPELIIVLQGEGLTIDLAGETFISKAGVTSSTFNAVPDVPFTTFDLKLPEGPNSALAANGNLCKGKLVMPTTITGQNGAVIKQNTRVKVAGCPKAKKAKAARAQRAKRAQTSSRYPNSHQNRSG
jgi:hypothetical protein